MVVRNEERVLIAQHVHAREFDGDLILLDLERGEYFALNSVGAAMWHELVKGSTPAGVALALAERFDVTKEKLADDCARLVAELLQRKLVRKAGP